MAEKYCATVSVGATLSLPIVVNHSGTVFTYEFRTHSSEIAFSISFKSDPTTSNAEEIGLHALQTCQSHITPTIGSVTAPSTGTVIFKWDNSSSWFSKELSYNITSSIPPAESLTNEISRQQDEINHLQETITLLKKQSNPEISSFLKFAEETFCESVLASTKSRVQEFENQLESQKRENHELMAAIHVRDNEISSWKQRLSEQPEIISENLRLQETVTALQSALDMKEEENMALRENISLLRNIARTPTKHDEKGNFCLNRFPVFM